jgi:hypothetical protein
MGFASGFNAGVNLGNSIKHNIQREKDNERRDKFDQIDMEVREVQLAQARKNLAQGDQYDQIKGFGERWGNDMVSAQQAVAMAQTPEEQQAAQLRLQMTQSIGDKFLGNINKQMKPSSVKVEQTTDEEGKKSVKETWEESPEEAQRRTRLTDWARSNSKGYGPINITPPPGTVTPAADGNALVAGAQQLAVENSPAFQDAYQRAQAGGVSFQMPRPTGLSGMAVQPVSQYAPVPAGGRTITNPKTGQQMILRNGAWEAVQ